MQGAGRRVQGAGCRVWGLGFCQVQGFAFRARVWGVGLRLYGVLRVTEGMCSLSIYRMCSLSIYRMCSRSVLRVTEGVPINNTLCL